MGSPHCPPDAPFKDGAALNPDRWNANLSRRSPLRLRAPCFAVKVRQAPSFASGFALHVRRADGKKLVRLDAGWFTAWGQS